MSETDPEINPRNYEGNLMGDTPYTNLFRTYEDSLSLPMQNDYKMSYAPTMETQIRKLRLSMEDYRELILTINSILLWEKQWYSSAIVTGCTILFTLLWIGDPNILTIISTTGLIITIGDYILPTVTASIFRSNNWNALKQKQYEDICTNIVLYKTKFELLITSYYRMRITNPKMYFTLTILGLAILTWIGGTINNLFLSYLFVLMTLLLPGMIYNGFLNKTTDAISKIFADLVENAKSKVGQRKND